MTMRTTVTTARKPKEALMKKALALAFSFLLVSLLSVQARAQTPQEATVGGLLQSEQPLPEGTRVGVHVVDMDGVTLEEVSSAAPVAGTFSVTTAPPSSELLQPLRGGAIPLPGLQNEYRVSPEGVSYARALTKVYVDNNGNEAYDNLSQDTGFLGVARVEDPVGFFVLLYVDEPATLSGRGNEVQLEAGWNVFTARFPEGGDPLYGASESVDDAVLDVIVP